MSSSPNNSSTVATGELPPEEVIFGCSPAMRSVRQNVEKVAGTNVPLLIQGESGTGKEVVVRLIHARSPWRAGPFVKVNCAAIPPTLLESELFGYQKAAFTGAQTFKPGRVEMSHGGTLYLDEIAELDLALQAKLLEFLQDGHFCRIGDQDDTHVETRVICATNRRLEQEIEKGNFRSDLFYRINVISIHMPRLRDRRPDTALLAEYFLRDFNRRYQRNTPPFSKEMLRLLESRDWPGNIRELENLIKRYVILGREETFASEPFERRSPPLVFEPAPDVSIPLKRIAKEAIREMERNLILKVLQANHWNRRKAADVLNISYRALIYKIREAGLSKKSTRKNAATPDSELSAAPSSGAVRGIFTAKSPSY